MMLEKIGLQNVARKAVLYARQSSVHQVQHNRESRMLQYAMRDRLTPLGWTRFETIDEDLGRSAASSCTHKGFERMVADVCLGKAGAVAAREVSRFARNSGLPNFSFRGSIRLRSGFSEGWESMPFRDDVDTECEWDALDDQVRNKVNEIAEDCGRGSHGKVMLTNGVTVDHWRAGDYRIFGAVQQGSFMFVGWGMHTGRGDNKYKVALCDGSSCKAMTS